MSLTPEERAARRIGGSTIAKILKKSRWGTPLDAYLELTGERPSEDKTGEDIDRGNFLEPAIRDWASKKTNENFLPSPQHTLKEWDWATVRPDGIGSQSRNLLEIKAPRRDDIFQWGEEGSDEVPNDALLQTHWGMMVTDAHAGVVAALLGGELRIYRVKRDKDLEAKILAAAKSFVDAYVLPRVPPPPEWGDDANVLYLHPKNIAPHRRWDSLSEQEKYVVGTYLAAYQFEKEATKALEGWEPVVKNIIGDASGIDAPLDPAEWQKIGGMKRIDFKNNATAPTRWKELAESLMAQMPAAEQEELRKNFAGTPARVFRPYFTAAKGAK